MRRERLGEGAHVRSGRRVGHADDLRPMRAQQGLEIEIAGIVDQHGVAGPQQEAADQVDRLGADAVSRIWSGAASTPSSANWRASSRRRASGPRVLP